ncbi:MAG: 50S ribosomal protein L21 [Treponema sp.]|nr:50S ribosomal protein L21 [Treponema sp.]
MYALVEFKGRQYKAEKGALLKVDRIDAEAGAKLDIDTVLLLSRGENDIAVGTPYVAGAMVRVVVERHEKGEKIIIFKYKPKKDYRRKTGHRQHYSVIRVEDIAG